MIFDSFCVNCITVIIALISVTIAYFKYKFQYWKNKNFPCLEPSIPFGNIANPFTSTENGAITLSKLYNEMKSKGWKHGGLYTTTVPSYLPVDLDYLKNVMSKDFQYFSDRGMYVCEKSDPLSAHLFALGGTKWRNLRVKLTPTFTSGKMKMMFQTLIDCIPNFLKKIENDNEKDVPIDIKEYFGCYTTDIIGSCAFGLDCKSFEDDNSPFRVYGKKFFTPGLWSQIKQLFGFSFPEMAQYFGVAITPNDMTVFFMKLVKDTVSYREENNIVRNDFMQLMIDLKNNKFVSDDGTKYESDGLTIEEIAAQCFVFFLAGFETSSTTITFALYELSRRPDLQEKVRNEIEEVLAKHDGQISYEAIQEMKYMDQVISETLRKYPPLAILTRKCVKDYKLPDEDVIIEKGTFIIISVLGIHYDEEYYPEPENFDPERFTEENKSKRHHFAYLPFGEGPRLCIGMRFGMMQAKVGLTALLKNYKFSVNEKTVEPIKMKVFSIVLAVEGEVWLDAEKITF